jgi:predicted metalloprotease with PDZ domain
LTVAEPVAGVAYRLRMPEPHTHLLHVELAADGVAGPGAVWLVMPSWTPGSYLMREFPRNVQGFAAEDGGGAPLAWSRADKNTWRVAAPADGRLRVRYAVYAAEPTVRTSHLDSSHASVNGASVFMYLQGRTDAPATVRVEAPDGWRTTTALPEAEPGVFRAADYDELVDSPLEIGTHRLIEWEAEGKRHRYALWGRGNLDEDRLVADTTRVIRASNAMFGSLPYPDFTFIVHLASGYGGLEHRNSTVLLGDRWGFRGTAYEQFIGLVAHEFFHLWNGKRIRPGVLGPFDYTRETYTRDLWVVEGITTYYTDLLLLRAGLITSERYLEKLAEAVSRYLATPGRHEQSLADSSFETWIRFYRPDASTPNAQVSYYQKGALVALLLDMEIRDATGGARSLDDVMRGLWERYGEPDVGFAEGAVEALAAEVAGRDLRPFFDAYLRGTAELDLDGALARAGLRLARGDRRPTQSAAAPPPLRAAVPSDLEVRTGLRLKAEGGTSLVTHVITGSPAYRAGVNAGDELVALDGLRVSDRTLLARLEERPASERVPLTVFRRDELVTLELEAAAGGGRVRIEALPGAEEDERAAAIRGDWLRTDVAR